jgi:nucleoid-associated protein YgaU
MRTLSPAKIDKLVIALASGSSMAEAADAAKVSLRSAERYASAAEVKSRVAEIRDRMFAQAVHVLANSAGAAARAMRGLIDSEDERVRLAAAKCVLEIGPVLHEYSDLTERLAAIEARDREREESLSDHQVSVVPREARA